MESNTRKKIIALLGVGFDHEDNHIRLTNGDKYDIYMGSDESHEYLHQLILNIELNMKEKGKKLEDFTPDEFIAFFSDLINKEK